MIGKNFRLALAAAISLVAINAPLQAAEEMAVASPQQQKALELAQILNSEAIMIGDDKSDAKSETMALELLASDAEIQELEKEFPGFGKEIAQTILPIINKYTRPRLPDLHARQSALYLRTFSEAELDRLIGFYSSPTGQKLINGVMDNIEPTAMLEEMKGSEDYEISSRSVLKDIRQTVPTVMKTMTTEDNKALADLMKSGLLGRMKSIASETQDIALKWIDESSAAEEDEVQAAINAVLERRMEGSEK
jgi:hypothetical protein